MEDLLKTIISRDCYDPFTVLGLHVDEVNRGYRILRTYQPHASQVMLVTGDKKFEMSRIHPEGIFEIRINSGELPYQNLDPFDYRYEITYFDANSKLINDPYRFPVQMSDTDQYLFNSGTNYCLYNLMGAQLVSIENISGTLFRVWAPNARSVSVIGHFNGWDGRVHQMRVLGSSGIWELFIPGLVENELYRFQIKTTSGHFL